MAVVFVCASVSELSSQILTRPDYLCGGDRIGDDFYEIEILRNDELAGSTGSELVVTFLNNPTPYATLTQFGSSDLFIGYQKTEDVPISVDTDSLQYTLANPALGLGPDTASIYIAYGDGCIEGWGQPCSFDARFSGLESDYCSNQILNLGALVTEQSGGVWYLNNSSTPITTIDLDSLPLGVHTLDYELSFRNCSDRTTQQFNLIREPNASWDYTPQVFCSTAPDLDLTTIKDTTGGIWTINSVINPIFSPNTLGAGDYLIEYQITDGTCLDRAGHQFRVDQQPNAQWDFPNKDLCSVDSRVNLVELASNPNGSWTINSMPDSILNPRADPPGDYTISYKIINGICADSMAQLFRIRKQPNARWDYFKTVFCSTDQALELAIINRLEGSVWSIDGRDTTHFAPRELAIGNHTIELKLFNEYCVDSFSNNFSIQQQADPAWMNDTYEFCHDEDTLKLRNLANLPGSSWRVNGVEIDYFLPANYSEGNHLVLHRVEQGVCLTGVSRIFEVQRRPSADWNVPKTAYCSNDTGIDLGATSTTQGGEWFINGSANSRFTPSTLNPNTYLVTHRIANSFCVDSLSKELTVDSKPDAQWAGVEAIYCNNHPSIELKDGRPSGGEWLVNGVQTQAFEPQKLQNSTHQIEYIFFNGGCSDTASQMVEVIEKTDAQFSIDNQTCSNADDLVLDSLNPNGVWFLDSLQNSIARWSPSSLDPGDHRLIHLVDNGVCPDTLTKTITVIPISPAIWKPLPDSICIYSNAIDLDNLLLHQTQNSIWTIDSDTVSAVYEPFEFQKDSLTITHINSNGICKSQYQQTIYTNDGPLKGQVELEICGNQGRTLALIDSQRTVWFGQNQDIDIEFIGDSVAFGVNELDLIDTLIALELDGQSCLQRAIYAVDFSRKHTLQPDAGQEIVLGYNEPRFSLQANEPEFGKGKWIYDQNIVQLFNPEEPISSGKLLQDQSIQLVWAFESKNCPTLTDTLWIIKTIFKISAGISPNGDGINDYFEIIGGNQDDQVSVTVINRWGQVVFESNDYLNDWSGTNRQGVLLPIDTYFYTVSIRGLKPIKLAKGELVIRP